MLSPHARVPIAVIVLAGAAACTLAALLAPLWTPLPLGVTLALLAFFRDPSRKVPADPTALLAPADGRVIAVQRDFAGPEGLRCLRVLIFLSVLDVHVNRAPCAGRVQRVVWRDGSYRNALYRSAADSNASCSVWLTPAPPLSGPVCVRQIVGALARRIVCAVKAGEALDAGARYGMIRFGSQTELLAPESSAWQDVVLVGSRVKAGETVLARWRADGGGEPGPAPRAGAE